MGWGQSKKYISEAEISDDDLDDICFTQHKKSIRRMNELVVDNRLDAILRPPAYSAVHVIPVEKLTSIEEELDNFELVSLLYLLYENSELALSALEKCMMSDKNEGLLCKWIQLENDRKWQRKLLEALCIVQNYKILKSLGYDKVTLQGDYMPSQVETSFEVKKIRKVQYIIAEKLTSEQTSQFIHKMKDKLDFTFPNYNPDYLELYFLHWEKSRVDVRVIQQVFKSMGLEQFSDYLESFVPSECSMVSTNNDNSVTNQNNNKRNTTTMKDNTYLQPGTSADTSITTQGLSAVYRDTSLLDSNRYPINEDNPGVVLIINQEVFFTEPDKQYENLLHESNEANQLPSRQGTEKDSDRLYNLFNRMRFSVKLHKNLPHYEMLKTIEQTTDAISEESSFIICILSHGGNGVVYGANSCKVEVIRIQNIMCMRNKKLIGKPKLLILQSCQGERCQKIEKESYEEDNDSNAVDGPGKVPPTADLLTFWATIPGFAAVRNINNGSWFIQALCDEIEEGHSQYHFLDICTRAINKVTGKKWKEESRTNVMTPMTVCTLRKSYYLPPLSS